MRIKSLFFGLLLTFSFSISSAQMVVSSAGLSPQQLITQFLSGEGVVMENGEFNGRETITAYGNTGTTTTVKIGTFTAPGFPIESGIVMTTNSISVAPGPNNAGGATGSSIPDLPADQQLQALSSQTLQCNSTLEFDFTAESSTFQFEYIFASEEYPEYACSGYNDVFAFFLTGPDPVTMMDETWNVAIIPGSDPALPVKINTINAGVPGTSGSVANCTPPNGSLAYAEFYQQNIGSITQFDAYTVTREDYESTGDIIGGLIATSCIIPCTPYHMKLSIANAGDNSYDSGVFLKEGSFLSPEINIDQESESGNDTLITGCNFVDVYYELGINTPCDQTYMIEINTEESNVVLNEQFIVQPYNANDAGALLPAIVTDNHNFSVSTAIIYEQDPDAETLRIPLMRISVPAEYAADLPYGETGEVVVHVYTQVCPYLEPEHNVIRVPIKGNTAPKLSLPAEFEAGYNFCENAENTIVRLELNTEEIAPGFEVIWTPAELFAETGDPLVREFLGNDAVTEVRAIVVDGYDCLKDTLDFTIGIVPFPEINFSVSPESAKGCAPLELKFSSTSEPTNAAVTWKIDDLGIFSNDNPLEIAANLSGEHEYQLKVETAPGCADSIRGSFNVIDRPKANFTWDPEVAQNGKPIQFTDLSTSDDPIIYWNWLFGDGGQSGLQYPIYSYRVPNDAKFPVKLTVHNSGCEHDTIMSISVIDNFSLYVPSAFNPVSDNGANRIFKPVVKEVKKYHLTIYNRNGECVFQTVNPEIGWDGMFNGEMCDMGVYVWKIVYIKYDAVATEIVKTGTVTLIH